MPVNRGRLRQLILEVNDQTIASTSPNQRARQPAIRKNPRVDTLSGATSTDATFAVRSISSTRGSGFRSAGSAGGCRNPSPTATMKLGFARSPNPSSGREARLSRSRRSAHHPVLAREISLVRMFRSVPRDNHWGSLTGFLHGVHGVRSQGSETEFHHVGSRVRSGFETKFHHERSRVPYRSCVRRNVPERTGTFRRNPVRTS